MGKGSEAGVYQVRESNSEEPHKDMEWSVSGREARLREDCRGHRRKP